jgi:hypothetical protein
MFDFVWPEISFFLIFNLEFLVKKIFFYIFYIRFILNLFLFFIK